MGDKLGWGILSTGRIAGVFAEGVLKSKLGRLVAVGSRTKEKAEAFGAKYNIPKRHGSYEELLVDPEVEAVYIATPHPMHGEWAWKAAECGRHILCEKSLTLNHADAMRVIDAALRYDVFLMEAYMYRCHPQTKRLVELIRERVIGDVRLIQAAFSFHAGFNPESRLFRNALGGGGILDVGGYAVSMARLIAGVALGGDFADPIEVKGAGHVGQTGVDEYATAVLRFQKDIIGLVSSGVSLTLENVVHIYGTEGHIFVPSPWTPGRGGEATKIIVNRRGKKEPREIVIEPDRPLYAIEADTVAENISDRQAPPPAMTWDDTLGNMKTLDMWREQLGQMYDSEKPAANTPPVHGRPLSVRSDSKMLYGRIEGVQKKLSRVVMGADNQRTQPHADAMFDDYFERGGNTFDTAYIYGSGMCETVLGNWIRKRGVREQAVILAKGAHTPFCDPENLAKQLLISLDRLQTDHVDIYMMHRDNPAIPVGEFVEVLNEHKRAGRIRAFGGSNWTIGRIEAFNEYAKVKGLTGFSAVSNNFSLAWMMGTVWAGCLHSSDPESRAWFTKTQMPLMPWSSQARGFFVFGDLDYTADRELVRCWYSEENFKRLDRARELAKQRGVQPIQIALAYVLCQPFPTFPLIGPRTIAETRSSMIALGIKLTPEQVRWLALGE